MPLILLAVAMRSAAAFCAKEAALTSAGHNLLAMVFNVWFLAEMLALFLQAVAWACVLRRHALSHAYPYMSLVFVINLLMAWLVFHEEIRLPQILGIAIILVGVLIVTASKVEQGKGAAEDALA